MKKDIEHHCIKCKLKTLIKFKEMIPIIKNRVDVVNKIWVETYWFFNQFVLKQLSLNIKPQFDYSTIERCALFVLGKHQSIRCTNIDIKKINNSIKTKESEIKDLEKKIIEEQKNAGKTTKKKKTSLEIERDKLSKEMFKLLEHIRKYDEYVLLMQIYKDEYLPLGKNHILQFSGIKSITRPIEYLSREILVNIQNHCSIHFIKYQRKYLKAKVWDTLDSLNIKKSLRESIISCIQYHINNKVDGIVIRSPKIKKMEGAIYKLVLNIMKDTIANEKPRIPRSIYENISGVNLKTNIHDVLKYYSLLIKDLELMEKERFQLLPQLTLGYRYIKFDSRFMSTVYNEWISNMMKEAEKVGLNKINSEDPDNYKIMKDFENKRSDSYPTNHIEDLRLSGLETVRKKYNIGFKLKETGIKLFEKDYKKYYKRCFNLERFNLRKTGNPISILTNGYSACLLFEKSIPIDDTVLETDINDTNTTKSNKKSKPQKDDVPKINLDSYWTKNNKEKKFKRGIFDAEECTASPEFLNKFYKIGVDPNNDVTLYCQSETGHCKIITKGYYNEISHITRNTKRMKKLIRESPLLPIFSQFADSGYRGTVNLESYNKYIKIYRENWNTIWRFYNKGQVKFIEYDSYINKKKACQKIAKLLIPKNGYASKISESKNKYSDSQKFKKVKFKPPLFAFGKGNGSTTISNLRNKGPKGPIKKLAYELSKKCIVMLTPEYNTSQVCSDCKEKNMEHPVFKKTIKVKNKETGKREKKEVNHSCYKLCRCSNLSHLQNEGTPKMWNRDHNASKNILRVMESLLVGRDLGIFKRSDQTEDLIEKDSIEESEINNISGVPIIQGNKNLEYERASPIAKNGERKVDSNVNAVNADFEKTANVSPQLEAAKTTNSQDLSKKDDSKNTSVNNKLFKFSKKMQKKHNVIIID